MKRIPIKEAREFAKKYDKDQVIIFSFSRGDGKTWVTTYGNTLEDCDQAARGANIIKKRWEWPEELCNEEPSRVKKLKNKNKELEEQVRSLRINTEEL